MRLRDLYLKCKAVVESCETIEHKDTAETYLFLAEKEAYRVYLKNRLKTDQEWSNDISKLYGDLILMELK
jgi:hypothetical protein